MTAKRIGDPNRGVALLMVVLVLSMLTIVGVLFCLTVSVHLKTNIQYREQAEVQEAAWMGLHRFASELMYNVWGANEARAFTCADGTPLGVPLGTRVGDYSFGTYQGDPDDPGNPPTAYYKSATDPSGESGCEPLVRPWATFTRSVTTLDYGDAGPPNCADDYKGNENDYRWMVGAEVWGGDSGNRVIAERLRDGRLNKDGSPRAVHSGGLYHDEFLPTGLSNSDLFELQLHFNHGTIFGRCKSYSLNDGADTYVEFGGDSNNISRTQATGYGPYVITALDALPGYSNPPIFRYHADPFWYTVKSGNAYIGFNAKNKARENIDTRLVGDSFYRIFRFDLVDPIDFKVRGTGVDPDKPGRYYSENEIYSRDAYAGEDGVGRGARINRALHLGDASGDADGPHPYFKLWKGWSFSGPQTVYADPLGKALNLNQVNNNYPFELYEGFKKGSHYGLQGADPWKEDKHHYNESKWIYLYDNDDDSSAPPWARYALYVWPDGGLPSANYVLTRATTYKEDSALTYNLYGHSENRFWALMDVGVGETGNMPDNADENGMKVSEGNKVNRDKVAGSIMGNLIFSKTQVLPTTPFDWKTNWNFMNNNWYVGKAAGWLDVHRRRLGSFSSRTELEVLLRKRVFADSDGELEMRRGDSYNAGQRTVYGRSLRDEVAGVWTLSPEDMRFGDAEVLAHHYTVNGYSYLLDPHWEQDRLVLDGAGMDAGYMAAVLPGNNQSVMSRHAASLADAKAFTAVSGGNQCRERFGEFLGSLKDFYGPYALSQPGAPSPAFAADYSASKDIFGSHAYVGPYHARKAKAMLLSALISASYPWMNGSNTKSQRQVFAVDANDLSGALLPNPEPESVLFSAAGKAYYNEVCSTLRLNEVGCGLFTVPLGPKLLDHDFHLPDPNGEQVFDWLKPTRFDDGTSRQMVLTENDYDHRYGFETKSMNFIELAAVYSARETSNEKKVAAPSPADSLDDRSFLRVYGYVRNWEGKCKEKDGNEVEAELGGRGYVDLFAKVLRKEIAPGTDKNGDGDYEDLDDGDMPPLYTVCTEDYDGDGRPGGWKYGMFYDPDHYVEGVVLRYQGSMLTEDVDRANAAGFYTGDTNKDDHYSFDRDWRVPWCKDAANQENPLMQPNLNAVPGNTLGPDGLPGTADDGTEFTPEVVIENGKYYDIRFGMVTSKAGVQLPGYRIVPTGKVGDNRPDMDYGWPRTGDVTADAGGAQPDDEIDCMFDARIFWAKGDKVKNSGQPYFECLADWLTVGRATEEEKINDEDIYKDRFSFRGWDKIVFAGANCISARFGSYTRFDTNGREVNPNNGLLKKNDGTDENNTYVHYDQYDGPIVTQVGDPNWGTSNRGIGAYILVIFPHARTPWTRRNPDFPKTNKTNKYGNGHFSDKDSYPGDSDAHGLLPAGQERASNFADGDAAAYGRLEDDHYHPTKPAWSMAKNDPVTATWRMRPRVYNWIKLNGNHPDKGKPVSGPGCNFSRNGATISGGALGNCQEALPFGQTQTFSSFNPPQVGRGFSARDPRDNCDPWGWDATAWNWGADCEATTGEAGGASAAANRPTPAYVAYDDRKIDWLPFAWQEPKQDDAIPGSQRGRFDWRVNGANANHIGTQMNQGDPTVTPARPSNDGQDLTMLPEYLMWSADNSGPWRMDNNGAGAEKGRFPFIFSDWKHERASTGKVFREILNYRHGFFFRGDRFFDKVWMNNLSLGTGDLRLRTWWDLPWTTRAAEYIETGSIDPQYSFGASLYSPVMDDENNDFSGAKERLTSKPLWGKRWKNGQFEINNDEGRYCADRKVNRRINLNEIQTPFALHALGLGGDMDTGYVYYGLSTEVLPGRLNPMTILGYKPLRGYTDIYQWMRRASGNVVRPNAFWSDNLWTGGAWDLRLPGGPTPGTGDGGLAARTTVSPSPVYTAYILAQKLDWSGQPTNETKMRVTVERTWDGKLHIVDFRSSAHE